MSIARSQFKLIPPYRNIIDIGDYYYFGPYLAGRDMRPLAFDRVLPTQFNSIAAHTSMMLNLSGACSNHIVGATASNHTFSMQNVSAQFSNTLRDSVFSSKLGATNGKNYVVTQGCNISEVKSNGELEYKGNYGSAVNGQILDFTTILDENNDNFFVAGYAKFSNQSDNTTGTRLHIVRISKSSFTASLMTSNSSAWSATTPGMSNYSKSFRYFGKMTDGKHLFYVYRTRWDSSNGYVWYFTLDVSTANGTIAYSTANNSEYHANIIPTAVPSQILATGVAGEMGYFFQPKYTALDAVSFIRRRVPDAFTTVPAVPSTGTDHTVCTISDLPGGFTLMTPGTDITSYSNYGQGDCWVVKDGSTNYLVYYAHNGGSFDTESSVITPPSRHQLVVFEINGSDLIYRSHINNAFGYAQQLTGFLRNDDYKTIVVNNTSGFGILTWSSDAKGYNVSPWRGVSGVGRIAFDKNSQIWVEANTTGEVFVFNPDLSASVVVNFAGGVESVTYTGTQIPIDAIINVYSFVGDRIAKTVRLVAKNCTFADGTTSKDITTSSSAPSTERILINGQGNVSVDAFIL